MIVNGFWLDFKGSAEEQIKQELKVVAEGVAASVFQSCSSSKVEPSVQEKRDSGSESNQGREVHNSDIENQHKAKTEVLYLLLQYLFVAQEFTHM